MLDRLRRIARCGGLGWGEDWGEDWGAWSSYGRIGGGSKEAPGHYVEGGWLVDRTWRQLGKRTHASSTASSFSTAPRSVRSSASVLAYFQGPSAVRHGQDAGIQHERGISEECRNLVVCS